MLLTYSIVNFHLFYDGAVDIQMWALLTRSRCKVSDTQVTVKGVGLLLRITTQFYSHKRYNERNTFYMYLLMQRKYATCSNLADFCFEIKKNVFVIHAYLNAKINPFTFVPVKEDGWVWRTKCPFDTEYRLWVRNPPLPHLTRLAFRPKNYNDFILNIFNLHIYFRWFFWANLSNLKVNIINNSSQTNYWFKTIIHRRSHFRFNIYSICMVYLLLNNMSKTTLKW